MSRVFVDTNVLFPFSLMDLVLALAEDFVHDLVLTDRLLDEWQHPDDLHHAAAAIAGQADALITWNLSDFPANALAAHGIAVSPPDPYLCGLAERYPDQVRETLKRMAAGKRRPPLTPLELVAGLERAGVPAFAQRLRRLLGTDPPPPHLQRRALTGTGLPRAIDE